jgi:hypothetical protein
MTVGRHAAHVPKDGAEKNERRTGQGAGELIAVQHSKVSQTNGQVAVGPHSVPKHQTVTRAVHGLCHTNKHSSPNAPMKAQTTTRSTHFQPEPAAFHVEREHVLQVMVVVSGDAPQIQIEHVWRHDLRVPTPDVLRADVGNQAVVNVGASGHEERGAGRQIVEKEQVKLIAQHAVVTFLRLLQAVQVLLHQLLVREGHAINALQAVVRLLAQPVRRGVVQHLKGLDTTRVWSMQTNDMTMDNTRQGKQGENCRTRDMGAHAQINQRTAAVRCRAATIRNLGRNDGHLEGIVREHFQRLIARGGSNGNQPA